jgi:hypothetical protein
MIAAASIALLVVACTDAREVSSSAGASEQAKTIRSGAVATAPVSGDMASRVEISADRAPAPAASPAPPVAEARAAAADHLTGQLLPSVGDPAGAMLVRTGEASLEVKHVEDALAEARKTAAQFGGFVANPALRNGREENHAATLELRVPSAQFDALVGALGKLGKVESVTATVQDVGEEYTDLGARASNARRMEARLVEMVATRTGKLSDALTVEQELKRVREEIERYEARLRWLERRASTSTLTVSLHEPLALIDRPRPGPIVEALGLAWQRTLGVFAWCIASLGVIVPVGLLVGLAVYAMRRLQWPRYRAE